MLITSKNVWIDENFMPATLELQDGKIAKVLPYNEEGAKVYGEAHIIPGLIDIHTHGYMGSATDGDAEVYRRWASYLPQEGVTTFLIGTHPREEEYIIRSLKVIKEVMAEDNKGAFIHGIFFQGPYLSVPYKGAYDPKDLKKASVEDFIKYNELSGNNIRSIAIAPEVDENHELIKYCAAHGIKVCIGFSGCSYEEAEQAIDEGAINVIHCFNCMPPLMSREPGLPAAALMDDRIFSEVMTDGAHVHPIVTNLVGTMKGKDRLIAVTDCGNLKGREPGVYHRFGIDVRVDESGVVRWVSNGKLGGSTATLIQNVKNLQAIGKLPQVTAINAATINPARVLGIDHYKGLIKEGYQADITVFDDDYHIIQTYVKGEEML